MKIKQNPKDRIKSYLNSIIARLGYTIMGISNEDELRFLFEGFKPRVTNQELKWFGPKSDGGYVLPNVLQGITRCYSPGVNYETDFEEAMMIEGITCHLADASVDKPTLSMDNYTFDKVFIEAVESANSLDINNWIEKYCKKDDGDWMLQMDIEGAEYENLLRISDQNLKRFRIICLEVHDLHHALTKTTLKFYSKALARLKADFEPVFFKPNSMCSYNSYKKMNIPRHLEVTYLRKDYIARCTTAQDSITIKTYDHDGAERICEPMQEWNSLFQNK